QAHPRLDHRRRAGDAPAVRPRGGRHRLRPHRHPRRGARRARRSVGAVSAPVHTDATAEGSGRTGVFHAAYALVSVALVALITVIAFEGMAVSTAMPQAARELDAVRSYGLAFSVMLTTQLLGIVLAGVWCDRSGPLPSLYAGQLLFGAGCGLCGAAESF